MRNLQPEFVTVEADRSDQPYFIMSLPVMLGFKPMLSCQGLEEEDIRD